jgi:hypothetical protein
MIFRRLRRRRPPRARQSRATAGVNFYFALPINYLNLFVVHFRFSLKPLRLYFQDKCGK